MRNPEAMIQKSATRDHLIRGAAASLLLHGGALAAILLHGGMAGLATEPAAIVMTMAFEQTSPVTTALPAADPAEYQNGPPQKTVAETSMPADQKPSPVRKPVPRLAAKTNPRPAEPTEVVSMQQPMAEAPAPAVSESSYAHPRSTDAGTAEAALASSVAGASRQRGKNPGGTGAMLEPQHYGLIFAPKPDYPLAARRRGTEGRVVLRVRVDEDGRVADLQVGRSSGSAMLDGAASKAVAAWRFRAPAGSMLAVPILFELTKEN